jgi:hypothetical protein
MHPLLHRLFWRVTGAVGSAVTTAQLWGLDRIAGPAPESPIDHKVREEGERLRRAFPDIDFDDPRPRTIPPGDY